ncbi:MAG: beta-lactamase family protein [Planctomycetales bacterium]|nr:beta-lactamase family protein [Planctomycetales bacterium]
MNSKRPIMAALWVAAACALWPLPAEAQSPPYDVFPPAQPPYYRVRYEASTEAGKLPYAVNYTVWIPPGVKGLRGLIVHQHGCGEGSCKSGLTGAYDLHWQQLAKKHACALLAPSYEQPQTADCQMWCDPRNGSSDAFLQCLVDLGKQSGHPELPEVPWALWGHSGGGHWAGGMVLLHPQRVAAAWLRSGVPLLEANPDRPSIKPHTLPAAVLRTPIMCNLGTKEGVTEKEGRFAGVWPANEQFFTAVRSRGGLIGVAVDPLTSHECGNQRYLAIRWLDACLAARLPASCTEPLRDMPTDGAWLAPVLGGAAVAADSYDGDPLKAAWLPNEAVARAWTQYIKDTAVSDTTPPPAPRNVRVDGKLLTWDADADLESGLAGFVIERDGAPIGNVPEQAKNPFGRPLFQNLQYSDTPTQPLAQMQFTDDGAEVGKQHAYRVIAVNTVGLKSKPATPLPTAAPESVGMSASKLQKLNELMDEQVAQAKIAGGVVVVARRGKVVHFESYGHRDRASGDPMQKDTIVRLYSMTKAVVTAAAMMLVDEGKIKLDDPASKYAPALADVKVWTADGLVEPKRAITVADLMRHTAGFGSRGADPVGEALGKAKLGEAKDLDDYVERLAAVPLAYHPGEKWIYSNSIDVLGLVVQKASGKPLGEFLDERLLMPLGMLDTGFYVPADKLDRFAVCYRRDADGLTAMDEAGANQKYHQMPAVQSGGGGLVGTAEDYARFLLMIAGGGEWDGKRYLSPRAIQLMTSDQLPREAFPISFGAQVRHGVGFGFGFNVRTADTEWDPAAHVGEFGWGGAASTHYWVSPNDDGLVVVTLEQVMPYNFDTEWLLKPAIYDAIEK